MDHKCVANRDRVKFQMQYKSVFNHALNSKRSTCEQAGKVIMGLTEEGMDRFTIDKLYKISRATTEREENSSGSMAHFLSVSGAA
jgi:hypothetical protein